MVMFRLQEKRLNDFLKSLGVGVIENLNFTSSDNQIPQSEDVVFEINPYTTVGDEEFAMAA